MTTHIPTILHETAHTYSAQYP